MLRLPLGCDLHFEEPPDVRAWRKGERARLLDARRAMLLGSHNIAGEAIRNALYAANSKTDAMTTLSDFGRVHIRQQ